MIGKLIACCAAASMVAALAGCAGASASASAKTYDIAPIFPLSSGKCAKYDGDQQGSGLTASCMVDKSQREKAASDWRNAMQSGGVPDAVEFSCN